MDILHKLRLIFWLLVIGLWGLFMYQYMMEDFKTEKKIPLVKNIFSTQTETPRVKKLKISFPQKTAGTYASIPKNVKPQSHLTIPLKTEDIKEIPSGDIGDITGEHTIDERRNILQKQYVKYPEIPLGFKMKETRHFIIYEEGKVREKTVKTLEDLHGNIMLDLIAFSPWSRDKKVFIFFSHSQSTYAKLTGRPSWSGGTASLSQRKIYVYDSQEAYSILAHELTHIYFDGFFAPAISPLWLSEGMAVYVQVKRGYSAPLWLKANMQKIISGSGYSLDDLMRIETLTGADSDSVRLWYAESYSIVKFLMRMKAGDAFYQFCKMIKEGKPVHSALYRAYGMPFNRVKALEYAWRYDLKTKKISGLAPR